MKKRQACVWERLIREEAMARRLGIELARKRTLRKKRHSIEIDSDKRDLARTIGWSLLILACLVGLLFFVYNRGQSLNPPEYEGKIVEKWADYSESEQGSRPYFRLLVEPDNGLKFAVAIDRENYHRARVGMRIKKTRKGIELSRLPPIREELKEPHGNELLCHLR